ncbi:MAG: MFS transporter, partial [Alphaproteobacteria bacterium]
MDSAANAVQTNTGFSAMSADKHGVSLRHAWLVWGCAAVFYLYEYALRASPSVMTHELMADFGLTSTTFGVLASFYYYSYVALQVPCGIIVDRLGPRRVITFSAILCILGSYLFAESYTLFSAQMGRFLLGAGSACAYLSCAKIGAEWFPAPKFALIASVTMMMGTFGGIVGTLPTALLMNAYGWRLAMVIMAVIGIAVAAASWLIIRDRPSGSENTNNYALAKQKGLLGDLKDIVGNPQIWL